MVSLRSLFRYGELAFAAYARTAAAPSLAQALRNIEFADTHALRLPNGRSLRNMNIRANHTPSTIPRRASMQALTRLQMVLQFRCLRI